MSIKDVVIVGCGGIGSHLLPPLVRFLADKKFKGCIHLWDGDKFENKNVNRQEFNIETTGQHKANVMAEKLSTLHPNLMIIAHPEYVTASNAHLCVQEGSLVFACVDNHPARVLLCNLCEEQKNATMISAGNELFDGNAHMLVRRENNNFGETIIERHPEILEIKTGERAAGCEEIVESGGTQLLITNFLAASSSLLLFHNIWSREFEPDADNQLKELSELYFDINQGVVVAYEAQIPSNSQAK